jgi:effector-binding domain-containing protein
MLEAPKILETASQLTAAIRLTIPKDQIQVVMGPAYAELMAAVAAQGIPATGPWFSHHFRITPESWDFEVGVPVARPIAPAGRVRPSRLPAATVARTVYCGPYEGLGSAWGEFEAWIAAAGHTASPELWECYAAGPESGPDPAAYRTDLFRPLVR